MSGLDQAWTTRSRRERAMIAALGLVVVAVAGWYGLARPLDRMAAAAARRAETAAQGLAQVDAEAAAIKAAGGKASGDLLGLVTASAQAAHIVIARQRQDSPGQLTVSIDSTTSPALFAWFRDLQIRDGVGVASLTATRTGGGLQVEAVLARP